MNDIQKLKELLPFSKKLNILFVEDNEEVQNQVVKMLKNFFDNIDIANDGEEALKMYYKFETENNKFYDIVITDLSMPKMGGIELCKELKSVEEEQVILVLSAYSHPENLYELINLGIAKFIQKPINQKNILETLVHAIELCKNGNNTFD